MDADGTDRRQLTSGSDEMVPVASPNGSAIYFSSNQTGSGQIWQMKPDGTNQSQVTFKDGGFPLVQVGDWLYYHATIDGSLRRVSLLDHEEQPVIAKNRYRYAVSPDGSVVAFSERSIDEGSLTITSLVDGKVVKSLPTPEKRSKMIEIAWLPDKSAVVYILTNSEYGSAAVWLQPLNGQGPQRICELGDDEIRNWAVSHDGKSFAVVRGGWKYDASLITHRDE
jgi:Tol biopolymer transport system component